LDGEVVMLPVEMICITPGAMAMLHTPPEQRALAVEVYGTEWLKKSTFTPSSQISVIVSVVGSRFITASAMVSGFIEWNVTENGMAAAQ